jgi:predicted O-methyltransferase YrrM
MSRYLELSTGWPSENYEELRLLARCDRNGREQGVQTPDLDEAIEYLRGLARMCGECR